MNVQLKTIHYEYMIYKVKRKLQRQPQSETEYCSGQNR